MIFVSKSYLKYLELSILSIRLKNYCDKDDFLNTAGNSPYVFENFTTEYKNEIEKVHTSFMKRTLNVSK